MAVQVNGFLFSLIERQGGPACPEQLFVAFSFIFQGVFALVGVKIIIVSVLRVQERMKQSTKF